MDCIKRNEKRYEGYHMNDDGFVILKIYNDYSKLSIVEKNYHG
jgi:hypothetical protein